MRVFVSLVACITIILSATDAAAAADKTIDEGASRVVGELTACRAIADPTARLACFDRTAAALVAAQDNKTIVVVDRAEVKKVHRSLFGFVLPNINFFGKGDDAAEPEIKEIKAKIVKVALAGQGRFTLSLDDGTVWRMSESLGKFPPSQGDMIRIVRGALGSYRGSIEGSRYIQVNRIG